MCAKLTKLGANLADLKITAAAMSADNKKKDPKLWQKVDQGEYNVVYVTPEEILDPMGHFMTTTVKDTRTYSIYEENRLRRRR